METKRSFWPYGIMAVFILFILGTVALIVLASSSASDLVSADYYEQEIEYQGQIDRLNRTAQLDGKVSVAYDAATRRIKISLPVKPAGAKATGRIQLYRPSTTGLDRELKLELDATGAQSVDASSLLPGLWRVRVQWTSEDKEYFVDKGIVVERGEARRTGAAPVSNFKSEERDSGKALLNGSREVKPEILISETDVTPVLR
jgi:hypothetical protein